MAKASYACKETISAARMVASVDERDEVALGVALWLATGTPGWNSAVAEEVTDVTRQ